MTWLSSAANFVVDAGKAAVVTPINQVSSAVVGKSVINAHYSKDGRIFQNIDTIGSEGMKIANDSVKHGLINPINTVSEAATGKQLITPHYNSKAATIFKASDTVSGLIHKTGNDAVRLGTDQGLTSVNAFTGGSLKVPGSYNTSWMKTANKYSSAGQVGALQGILGKGLVKGPGANAAGVSSGQSTQMLQSLFQTPQTLGSSFVSPDSQNGGVSMASMPGDTSASFGGSMGIILIGLLIAGTALMGGSKSTKKNYKKTLK